MLSDNIVSPTPSAEILQTSDPKVAAVAIATGSKLSRVDHDPRGRLVFVFPDLDSRFLARITNDEIQVSALAVIAAWERIVGMIASAQRERRR